ncbi:hypothetical protein C9374_014480 [Naegleria lovaniensis]|uniref:tripeptidyl-peptidase II n=1 Tax=Naegleria lovaniensis TaxID=51637 RepID=A0AA88KML8_NAELO|nr:uncharacterized protein C9374_014480 [Naegleria lovaniensis]KAG2389080.1 hypothetical protein C9374_014480 [Naegleria lovaniensis]
MSTSSSFSFPVEGLQPKDEIQATAFLQRFPNYDGRGVIVAIFDTGVDVGAPGLKGKTTDGSYKIVDAVDCTGSGDVSCKTIVKADENGMITGKSGRKLKIDETWKEMNPSNQYRIGIKNVFDIYPQPLVDRVKEERKKQFQKKQTEKIVELKEKANSLRNSSNEESVKKQASEIDKQIAALEELLSKMYEDTGPVLDCVVFLDEKTSVWRAVVVSESYDPNVNIFEPVDEDQVIDLSKEKLLCDFKLEHQYGTFTELDLLNYSVNIYDNGDILSIVAPSGSHGTHVAGIVAAYFPDQPELNGVAPGAQIITCKIGDSRLGTMETTLSLNRALISCYLNKCSIINMSYGEPTSLVNSGFFKEKVDELVYEHNVTFVKSAGNSGPNFTTTGAPLQDACIGVGAYVTSSMMKSQYGLSELVPDSQFTWSSRGPTDDGAFCPWISAPGAAVTSVPNYTLLKNQRMNGTSMASPNAAGGLALLYSGLLAEKKQWNPYYIKRVIANTAKINVENKSEHEHSQHPCSIGHGLLQILSSYELIDKHPYNPETDNYRYEITIPQRNNARGIYLREQLETHTAQRYTVNIDLKYANKTKNSHKIEYEKRLKLVPVIYQGTGNTIFTDEPISQKVPNFIRSPEYLHLPGCFTFDVQIATEMLASGEIYSARLDAYDCDQLSFGPVFSVPITVIKPVKLSHEYDRTTFADIRMKPGELYRNYITTPSSSVQYCKITLRAMEANIQKMFVLHATQLIDKEAYSLHDTRKFINLSKSDVSSHFIKTLPNRTLELTVGQFWSTPGESTLTVEVEFFGFDTNSASNEGVFFDGAEFVKKIQINPSLRNMEMQMSAKLDTWNEVLTPVNSEDDKLIQIQNDERNTYFDTGKCSYNMILEYNLKMTSEHEITPNLPQLSNYLYESELESRMIMVFNKNKKLMNVVDFHPKKFKLKKGDYVLRVLLRHDSLPLLQKFKNHPLIISHALAKPISLKFYKNVNGALSDSNKQDEKFKMLHGRSNAFVLGYTGVDMKDLPKEVKAGDRLTGKFQYQSCETAFLPLTFVVPPSCVNSEKSSSTTSSENKADKRTPEDKYKDYILEQQLSYLKKLKAEALPFVDKMIEEHPKHLPALLLKLEILKEQYKSQKDETSTLYKNICELMDSVFQVIDLTALALHYGTLPKNKTKNEHEESEQEAMEYQLKSKEMDKQKDALISCWQLKLEILLDLNNRLEITDREKQIKEVMHSLRQWIDPTEKCLLLDIQYDLYFKQYSVALQKVMKALTGDATHENESKLFDILISVTKDLGFSHWHSLLSKVKKSKYPDEYPLF